MPKVSNNEIMCCAVGNVLGAMTDDGTLTADITVAETLELLDGQFGGLAKGVGEGLYTFWLGSGISGGRAPELAGLVLKILQFLQSNIDPKLGAKCPYRAALADAVKLADLSTGAAAVPDLEMAVDLWKPLDQLIKNLVNRYSQLLDIEVAGKDPDYLLWDGVDVCAEYGTRTDPDCEHLAFAMLALEGVITDAPTANWDGLLECALAELSGAADPEVQVVVLKEDLRAPGSGVRLLKFHGCAVLAKRDPTHYRSALIARQQQISRWPHDKETAAVRRELVSLATKRPTLMIGLSAQDANIQDIFAEAQGEMSWPWPSEPPAHVFAGERLGAGHSNILRIVYGDGYVDNAASVKKGALIRAFAKPLLIALALHILCQKLSAFVRECEADQLDSDALQELARGIHAVRDRVALQAEPDQLQFLRELVAAQARVLSIFRSGAAMDSGSMLYGALTKSPVGRSVKDPSFSISGLRELAAATGVLGRGLEAGKWSIAQGATAAGSEGAIRILPSKAPEAAILFAANPDVGIRLRLNGLVDAEGSDIVVVYSIGPVPALPRSPKGSVGRTGITGPREIDMRELLNSATSVEDLEDRFREAAIL